MGTPRLAELTERIVRANPQTLLGMSVVCGTVLRVWFAGTSGMYLDEAQVLSISAMPNVPDLLRFLASHESHPPGYYLLVRAWQGVFGGSNHSGIAFSLAAGVSLILVTHAVVLRLLGSPRSAVIAAWLVALSPTAVRYSGMVRPYVVLEILVLVAVYCLVRLLREGTWPAGLGFSASSIMMVYIHNWAWLVLAGLSIVATGWIIAGRPPRRCFSRFVVANLLIVVAFLPWLAALFQQVAVAGHPAWPRGVRATVAEATWVLTGVPLIQAVSIGLAILLLHLIRRRAGIRLSPERRVVVVLCLATVLIATGAAVLLRPIARLLIPQSYAMLTPLLLVAVATVLQVEHARSRGLAGGVFAVCLVASVGRIMVTSQWVRSDMREIGAFLTSRVAREDLVLVYPDYPAPTLARYFSPPGEVFTYPHEGLPGAVPFDHRIARDEDSSGIASTLLHIVRAAAEGRRTWFVTLENPPEYPRLKAEVERSLTAEYGPPACVFRGTDRPRLYEDMMVARFEVAGASATREPGAECR